MTACIKLECPDLITLKCDPDYALELRDHYPGVVTAATLLMGTMLP